ncbi:ATP-binding protein [Clostridium sp. YIM B02555]|uniref:ATP-binding protein n=1 Tax=Clostridium sp. YIM B02555 TaxID=2911968 RepID=UPI001EEE99C3|nr:ATP-binding protein [Clostridium sp. YIM B02555]
MQEYIPVVKDISLYREIAKNLVNPLELPREAISNSMDAECKNINIEVCRNSKGIFCIEIEDDGCGMDRDNINSFFNLGDSRKDVRSIGEKGLGTKIFFKSKRIIVETQRENKRLRAEMIEPWQKLSNNMIPSYTIEEITTQTGRNGTIVIIEGYNMDNPEKTFNFDTLKDYILWFTAGGSFKTLFATFKELNNYVKNMQVAPRIFINDKINNIKEEIAGTHQFFPPQENPPMDINEKVYKRSVNYCRHFGPYHRSTNINGEYVSFQMYGTVSGYNCRRSVCKLKPNERLKGRFGLYLAKDFIAFSKKSNLISDPNYHHFHILVNSQNFELTADRNNISNEDDPKIKWVLDSVKKIISDDIMPITENVYFKMRREEEELSYIIEKNLLLNNRLKQFVELRDLNIDGIPIVKVPDNEAQAIILLTAILSNDKYKKNINGIESIAHYSHQSTTDLICLDSKGKAKLVEVEYLLSNIFKHEHPYKTFDYIICWKIDMEVNERRKLVDGVELKLIKDNNLWYLKYGVEKIIPIIVLFDVVKEIEKKDLEIQCII